MDRGGRRSRSPRRVDRHRDRDRMRPGPYGKEDIMGRRPGGNRSPPYNRVFVSNIPYEEKWQALKDLFREKVGEVTYVELITDEMGKSRGYGIVEFKSKELVEEALKKMQGHEIGKRKIIVKEDPNGHILTKALSRDGLLGRGDMRGRAPPGPAPMPPPMHMPGMPPPMPGRLPPPPSTPNLPPKFGSDSISALGDYNNKLLQEITGGGPIGNTIFVANLDYKVTYSKLKEVFKLAGNVIKVDLHLDKDNKSRGMATVTYDTSMEAVQAISMFNQQLLFDRPMLVRMDKDNARSEKKELPSGLQSIGPSLNLGNMSMPDQRPREQNMLPGRLDAPGGLSELEKLTRQRILLESGLNGGLGGSSGLNNAQAPNLTGIPGLTKPAGGMLNSNPLGLNLSNLSQTTNPLANALSGGPLTGAGMSRGFDSLRGGASDISRLSAALSAGARSLDNSMDERSRLLSNTQIPGLGISDRERIELDIARVDSRIRDLDRSLAAVEDRKSNIHRGRDSPLVGGNCTVFVRNLPYTLTWQKLRDRFSRIGNVQMAEIKMENGRSKGYGRVRFETPEQARLAIRHFDGIEIEGRKIEVRLHEEKFGQRRN